MRFAPGSVIAASSRTAFINSIAQVRELLRSRSLRPPVNADLGPINLDPIVFAQQLKSRLAALRAPAPSQGRGIRSMRRIVHSDNPRSPVSFRPTSQISVYGECRHRNYPARLGPFRRGAGAVFGLCRCTARIIAIFAIIGCSRSLIYLRASHIIQRPE